LRRIAHSNQNGKSAALARQTSKCKLRESPKHRKQAVRSSWRVACHTRAHCKQFIRVRYTRQTRSQPCRKIMQSNWTSFNGVYYFDGILRMPRKFPIISLLRSHHLQASHINSYVLYVFIFVTQHTIFIFGKIKVF